MLGRNRLGLYLFIENVDAMASALGSSGRWSNSEHLFQDVSPTIAHAYCHLTMGISEQALELRQTIAHVPSRLRAQPEHSQSAANGVQARPIYADCRGERGLQH